MDVTSASYNSMGCPMGGKVERSSGARRILVPMLDVSDDKGYLSSPAAALLQKGRRLSGAERLAALRSGPSPSKSVWSPEPGGAQVPKSPFKQREVDKVPSRSMSDGRLVPSTGVSNAVSPISPSTAASFGRVSGRSPATVGSSSAWSQSRVAGLGLRPGTDGSTLSRVQSLPSPLPRPSPTRGSPGAHFTRPQVSVQPPHGGPIF